LQNQAIPLLEPCTNGLTNGFPIDLEFYRALIDRDGGCWVWGTFLARLVGFETSLGEIDMTKLMTMARQFRDDENGAAMVEYSILIGVIATAAIVTVIAIGLWVTGRFTGLCDAMGTSGVGACDSDAGTGS
jgi:pilus assembly protein Flp/PilA